MHFYPENVFGPIGELNRVATLKVKYTFIFYDASSPSPSSPLSLLKLILCNYVDVLHIRCNCMAKHFQRIINPAYAQKHSSFGTAVFLVASFLGKC